MAKKKTVRTSKNLPCAAKSNRYEGHRNTKRKVQ